MSRKPTSLRRRLVTGLTAMVLGTLAVGGGAVVAVQGLHDDLGVATTGFRQLRQLYDVGFLVARARTAADATPPDPTVTAAAVRSAVAMLDARGGGVDGPPPAWIDEAGRADCRRLLTARPVRFDLLFGRLAAVSADVRRSIADAQATADRRRRAAVRAVAAFCVTVAVVAVWVGVGLYRRVARPIGTLTGGARRLAGGDLAHRLDATGDAEFVALADDFNRMADQLQRMYADLDDRVRAAGRDLARAERLASVGYLAAGVAHEINNPLGIIAGYAERALRQLPADSPARRPLAVICDEAFRCKGITDQLLSLARPGEAARAAVSMEAVTRDTAAAVAALPVAGGRTVAVSADGPTGVLGSGGELRQVVLNLVVNALEADATRVTIHVDRDGPDVRLCVTDDGHGMSPGDVGRAFEPFYTRRGGGTGLGLSIAQAIVSAHGGRLTAASDGPGRGSRFTLWLPAAGSA